MRSSLVAKEGNITILALFVFILISSFSSILINNQILAKQEEIWFEDFASSEINIMKHLRKLDYYAYSEEKCEKVKKIEVCTTCIEVECDSYFKIAEKSYHLNVIKDDNYGSISHFKFRYLN